MQINAAIHLYPAISGIGERRDLTAWAYLRERRAARYVDWTRT